MKVAEAIRKLTACNPAAEFTVDGLEAVITQAKNKSEVRVKAIIPRPHNDDEIDQVDANYEETINAFLAGDNCPYCLGTIKPSDLLCPHCGRNTKEGF